MSERVSILRSSSDSTPFSSRLAATLSRPVFDQSTADFSRAHSLLPAHAGCTCSHNARGASSDERPACAMCSNQYTFPREGTGRTELSQQHSEVTSAGASRLRGRIRRVRLRCCFLRLSEHRRRKIVFRRELRNGVSRGLTNAIQTRFTECAQYTLDSQPRRDWRRNFRRHGWVNTEKLDAGLTRG